MTTVAVTGAAGFLGGAVVRAAKEYDVLAIARAPLSPSRRVAWRPADLRDASEVEGVLEGADVVIHLAAAKSGSFHDQYDSTVRATTVLLTEARRAGVRRVVLVSTFAVYDYAGIPTRSLVDEHSPVDRIGHGRDAYAQTKVLQELATREWAAQSDTELVIARPGVVYGPGNWWTYRIGERFGSFWLCIGNAAQVPVTYVDNCADALLHLATSESVSEGIYNVFDEVPSQREYRRVLAEGSGESSARLVIPWPLASAGVALLAGWNQRQQRPLRLPGFLVPESLAVRAKPLHYSNAKLRATGWKPTISLMEGIERTFHSRRDVE